ncbi:hypothetical protein D3C71_780060 [compost metagenome]
MISAAANLLDAFRAPGPDGGAHEMHGLDARSAQVSFQPQVEIRGIHTDEDIRAVLEQPLTQLLADAQQLAQTAQHFHAVAMHGQLLAGPPGIKTPALHLRATNAAGLQVWPMGLHAVDQQTGQQVARCLARHHGDAGGSSHHPALSALCRAWRRPGTAPSSRHPRWPAVRTAPAQQWRHVQPPA